MLVAAAFIETAHPVMHAIFVIEHSVHALMTSDLVQFALIINEVEGHLLQPVILNVIIVSESHLDQTTLCLGSGTHIKGQDKLPEWLMLSANSQEKVDKRSVGDLILNQDDSNNEILCSELTPEELKRFLLSAQGSWIR